MELTKTQQEHFRKRFTKILDAGGYKKVSDLSGITTKTIHKALRGESVETATVESLIAGLLLVESEKNKLIEKVEAMTT